MEVWNKKVSIVESGKFLIRHFDVQKGKRYQDSLGISMCRKVILGCKTAGSKSRAPLSGRPTFEI
jgi:hypothetical protein